MANTSTPLVILGMEAGDARFIRQWAEEGHLPTIASLMKRGCWSTFSGPEHCAEHGTGTTLFSGVSRIQHGYFEFRQLEPRSYNLVLTPPTREMAAPFWTQLRGTSRRVAILDAFEALVQPGLDGVQLANWAAHQPSFPLLPPEAVPGEVLDIARRIDGERVRFKDYVPGVSTEEDRRQFQRILDAVSRKGALLRNLLTRGPFDLVVAMFSEMHVGAHRFWNYRPEARGDAARPGDPVLTHAIRDLYQAIDREFASLLKALPEDANVFLFGMFGMKDHYPTIWLIEDFCRKLGYQAAPPKGGGSLNALALAKRMLPSRVQKFLGRFVSLEKQHRVLAAQLRASTDWSRTTAFAIPALFDSYIRVNLKGREPQGTVEPGREYEELLGRLEDDLKLLIDPKTNAPAVESVLRCVDLFGCPPPEVLPDLFVQWRPHTHLMNSLIHPRVEIVQRTPPYNRESYHSLETFMAAAGPAIQARGELGTLSLLDFAPTFLHLLGEGTPTEMTGSVLQSVVGRTSGE